MNIGLAIFVKTPGLSPVKTRLAKSIGHEKAEAYYILATKTVAAIVESLVGALPSVQPYWAVAENSAMDHGLWTQFPKIYQGEGDLGERLSHVYDWILAHHKSCVVIGADSPQLTPEILDLGCRKSSEGFVMGPSFDGGFYLFGGNQEILPSVWTGISYSTNTTGRDLTMALAPANITTLEKLLDTDTFEDVKDLYVDFRQHKNRLPEQTALLNWIETNLVF
ncbi:MAG: glycosyltransferase [Pseudomonadota bacterium]|nr:glycosyltransferase [Pseudomonadota bacterium]